MNIKITQFTSKLGFVLTFTLLIALPSFAQFKPEVKNVAIFVHQGVELFDFAGPGEVFVAAGRQSPVIDFNVYTVAATEDQVTSQTFLKIIPNYSIDNCPPPDVIVLPGGATGIPLKNPKVIEWIKKANEGSEVTLSVCTGAFLLGKAGLLEGLKATTHWGSIASLRKNYPNTEVLEETKFVDNGKIVTSGGVSSGTEGSLHVVSRLAGQVTAKKVARYMEYNSWDNRLGLIDKESAFMQAVKTDGFEKALAALGEVNIFYGEMLNLGIEYLEKEEAKKALPIFKYLTKKYRVTETFEFLGKAYKKMGKEVPPGEREFIGLIKAGEMDKAMALYEDIRQKYPDWLIFGEAGLNRLGYQLMSLGKMELAMKVFTLNAEEFPDSFNVWDSLAECYLKSGDKKTAKKYYQRSLELNPENTNATKVLESMDSMK